MSEHAHPPSPCTRSHSTSLPCLLGRRRSSRVHPRDFGRPRRSDRVEIWTRVMVTSMRVRYFGHTDVGMKRSHNEDAFLADPDLGLFVVCDGVGGRARGEIASREAVDFIWEWFK